MVADLAASTGTGGSRQCRSHSKSHVVAESARDMMATVEVNEVVVGLHDQPEEEERRKKRPLPLLWWLVALGVIIATATITFASGLLPIPQVIKSLINGGSKAKAVAAQTSPPAGDSLLQHPVLVEVGPTTAPSPRATSSPTPTSAATPNPAPSSGPTVTASTPVASAPPAPSAPSPTPDAVVPEPVPVPTHGNPSPEDNVPAVLRISTSVNVPFSSHAMAPGDSIVRTISVTNSGTVPLRYALVSQTDIQDADTAARVLRLTVKDGVSQCTRAGFSQSGRVLYQGILGSTAGINVLGDPASGPHAGDRIVAPGATDVLCVRVHLPASTGNSYQGKRTVAVLRFVAEEVR